LFPKTLQAFVSSVLLPASLTSALIRDVTDAGCSTQEFFT
jgi:hypothetical protein